MLECKGVDRRQFVGMQVADRAFDQLVTFVGGLEQDAELGLLLDLAFPGVDALDRRDLRAGSELALDQRTRQPMRFLSAGHGRNDGDRLHFAGSSVRSAGTTMTLRSSLPAMTENVVATPMRPPPSRRTRSSAPVTGSPSSASTMLPG
jgi:hypothetical protein